GVIGRSARFVECGRTQQGRGLRCSRRATDECHVPRGDQAPRARGLDGLRGLAALVVVVHHCLLTSPTLARAYLPGHRALGPGAAALTYSPLHLFWAGSEAVIVFFVLSGFVLTLAVSGDRADWLRYYPRRMLRLYVPVVGSVV